MSSTSATTCAYVVPRKKRRCKMLVKAGQSYCGEHIIHDSANSAPADEGSPTRKSAARVPCPYDPRHSCYAAQLEKHMAKCNSRPKPVASFIVPGVNMNCTSADNPFKADLSAIPDEELLDLINKVENIHSNYIGPMKEIFGQHPVMEPQLSTMKASKGSWRHLYQNSAILFNMDQAALVGAGKQNCYVEFGSGRGQLSYWVAQTVDLQQSKFVLIDKSSPRHKHDNRFKTASELNSAFERIRADIADVDLARVPVVQSLKNLVGIGKHLCGAATDLALMCLENSVSRGESSARVEGICIALCCHHRCSWPLYVGKQFFSENGLTETDFVVMRSLTSWATCGNRSPQETGVDDIDEHVPDEDAEQVTTPDENNQQSKSARLGLSGDKREEIGRHCKQVIDYGRVHYLQGWKEENRLHQSRLVYYVDKDISLENVLLLATHKH